MTNKEINKLDLDEYQEFLNVFFVNLKEINRLADEKYDELLKDFYANHKYLYLPEPDKKTFFAGFESAYKSLRSKVPEPSNKKTITLYQAVFKYTDIDRYYIPDDLFSCAQDAVERSTLIFVKLLTGRPIEIEVEE